MTALLPGNRTTAMLLVLCGLLSVIILVEVYFPEPASPGSDSGTANAGVELPATPVTGFAPRPFSDYAEILERPLLFAGRRMPPEPEQAAAPAIQRSPLRLKLEGVAISSDSRVALLRNMADNQLLQLSEGMSHDGWTLETLNSSAATFRRGEELTEVALETEPNQRRRR